jgi:FkbM family methyltransferase
VALDNIRRVKFLSRFMSVADAVRFVRREKQKGIFTISPRMLAHPVHLRGGTADIQCFYQIVVHSEYHCPFEISPKLIIDAGANIGLSSLYFAARYSDATIFAIEPEPRNFELLERNCRSVGQIKPLHGALWSFSGEIALTDCIDGQPWTYTVGRRDLKELGIVKAFSVPDVLEMGGGDKIDLLKLDIEGSEKEIFSRNVDWLDRTSVIAIELHDRYVPGCSNAFYQRLIHRRFHQEVHGENIFVQLLNR